jgi:hypothetical protein
LLAPQGRSFGAFASAHCPVIALHVAAWQSFGMSAQDFGAPLHDPALHTPGALHPVAPQVP